MSSYRAVSLFSGCGGFCEGVRLCGFDIAAAVEWDQFAAKTYRHNFPEVPLFGRDIREFLNLESESWLTDAGRFASLYEEPIDMVFGGPPCQGYSQIGTRILDDPRNVLYLEYVRVLKTLRPRVFLMENVPNMLRLAKGRFKHEALDAFTAAGYSNVAVNMVTASDYGVPQLRRRAIFFGVRDDLNLETDAQFFFESALMEEVQPTQTVWQAICDLPEGTASGYEALTYPTSSVVSEMLDELRLDRDGRWYSLEYKQRAVGMNPRLLNHHTKEIQDRRKALIALLKPGAKANSLPKSIWNGARPEKWRRLDPDRPAYTILAQMHRDLSEWVHPNYERWITVREAARLQSFHDGYEFRASEWQMLKQIGNAVPPLLGRALASVADRALLRLDGKPVRLMSAEPTAVNFSGFVPLREVDSVISMV